MSYSVLDNPFADLLAPVSTKVTERELMFIFDWCTRERVNLMLWTKYQGYEEVEVRWMCKGISFPFSEFLGMISNADTLDMYRVSYEVERREDGSLQIWPREAA